MSTHLILYDGVCGLCNRANGFILKRDADAVFQFASLQSRAGQSILKSFSVDTGRMETVYVVVDFGSGSPMLLSKSRAVLFVLRSLGRPWRLAAILDVLPRRLLDWAYDVIARNRYRVFDRYETCPTPRPEYRDRFLDA